MNNTHKLLLALLLALLAGCEYEERDKILDRQANISERVWMESSLGVRYFYDCIDGLKYIFNEHGRGSSIAGPLGGCK